MIFFGINDFRNLFSSASSFLCGDNSGELTPAKSQRICRLKLANEIYGGTVPEENNTGIEASIS